MAGSDAEDIATGADKSEASAGRRGQQFQLIRDYAQSINFVSTGKYGFAGLSQMDVYRTMLGASLSYTVNPQSYVNATLEYTTYDYAVRPESDPAMWQTGETQKVSIGNWDGVGGPDTIKFADKLPYGWNTKIDGRADGTWFNYYIGGSARPRDSSDYNELAVRASYVNQINVRNQVKAGLEWTSTEFHQYGGYAHSNHTAMQEFTATPVSLAGYVQDKIEYEGMIANIGLRFDYFDSKGETILGDYPFSPLLDDKAWGSEGWAFDAQSPNGYPTGDPDFRFDVGKILMRDWGPGGLKLPAGVTDSLHAVAASAKMKLSPRIGVSHPIGARTKIYFNYGHFLLAAPPAGPVRHLHEPAAGHHVAGQPRSRYVADHRLRARSRSGDRRPVPAARGGLL